jgi:hypothetical protein
MSVTMRLGLLLLSDFALADLTLRLASAMHLDLPDITFDQHAVDLVFRDILPSHAPDERVPVNAQSQRGLRLIALGLDEKLEQRGAFPFVEEPLIERAWLDFRDAFVIHWKNLVSHRMA